MNLLFIEFVVSFLFVLFCLFVFFSKFWPKLDHTKTKSEFITHMWAKMSFEDEKLVECLKANPCLWDKNRQDFRLSAMKDAKWKEIAAELDSTREWCFVCHFFFVLLISFSFCSISIFSIAFKAIRRYRTLRERFRRESIKHQNNPNFVSKWSLYDKISFLKEFQIPR